jgi:hypothetical protein
MTPPERALEQKARMLAAVRADPAPARRDVERRDVGTVVAAGLLTLVIFLAVGGPHATARPLSLVLASTFAWSVIAATLTGLALRRGRSMLGAPRSWLVAASVVVAPLLAIGWFALPSSVVLVAVPHAYDVDARCFLVTIAFALAPFVAFLALRREGDPVSPRVTAAATGAAAGAWGAVLIDLHCEMTDPRHVVLGHVLPVGLLVVLGALAGSSLAIRAARRR